MIVLTELHDEGIRVVCLVKSVKLEEILCLELVGHYADEVETADTIISLLVDDHQFLVD